MTKMLFEMLRGHSLVTQADLMSLAQRVRPAGTDNMIGDTTHYSEVINDNNLEFTLGEGQSLGNIEGSGSDEDSEPFDPWGELGV